MIDEGVNALGWVIFFCVFNMPFEGWTSNRSAKTFASFTTIFCIYKVKKFWLYTSAKHNQIPMCRIAGKIIGGRARKDCIRPEATRKRPDKRPDKNDFRTNQGKTTYK